MVENYHPWNDWSDTKNSVDVNNKNNQEGQFDALSVECYDDVCK